MFSKRKRLSGVRRSFSSSERDEESRTTPTPGHQRAALAARRALLLGITSQSSRRPSPELSPPRNIYRPAVPEPPVTAARDAILVHRTPRGSLLAGRRVPSFVTPGGTLRVVNNQRVSPPSSDVEERVEAMGFLNDDEAEDVFQSKPWHVRRWIENLEKPGQAGRECRTPEPVSPSLAGGEFLDNASGSVSVQPSTSAIVQPSISSSVQPSTSRGFFEVSPARAEVRPSVSGLAGRPRRLERRDRDGSDFDSEFDDEFDTRNEITAFTGLPGRDIPDNEELDEHEQELIGNLERAMDEEAGRLLGVSSNFNWVEGFEGFRAVPEVFSGPTPGPLKDYDTPYDAFTDIWDKDIMERIAQETNRYAKQTIDALKAKGTLKPQSRLHQWSYTTPDEIAVLFGVYMYMGIDPRTSQDEYWKVNDYLEMARFKEIMTYNRYVLLCKFLHFVDNSDVSQNPRQNEGLEVKRLRKLQPVISHLNCKFSSLYNLHSKIAIDESLTLFKGRLSFVQTIRSKSARFGIKSYELCESQTGYLFNVIIYTGKDSGVSSASADAPSADLGGKTTQIVLGLLKDLEHRGHCVTMDNFYNCPSLARYLKSRGFDCLGTLRTNRKHVPRDINVIPKNVPKGTIVARQCGDVSIIAWKDSKLVTIISTYHTDETYTGSKAGKTLVKPVCVRDYNKSMGGVDLKDQKLSMYLLERKRCVKWYIKMFKRLMNVSILNAFIMFSHSLRRRDMPVLTHREFRYMLAKSLVDQHRVSPPAVVTRPVGDLMRLRVDIMHEPNLNKNVRKRCRVCYRQGVISKVRTFCMTCDECLCFGVCWREWHSLAKLKGFDKFQHRYKRQRVV